MTEQTCLILHRKSANEQYVKDAVKAVKAMGHKLRVLVPFSIKRKNQRLSERPWSAVPPG